MVAFNSCGPALMRCAAALACASMALPALAASPAASSSGGSPVPTAADTEVLAGACSNCHGPSGHPAPGIPSLSGQSAERLLARMRAFQAGTAPDATVMPRLMKGYDAAQLQALATWFAGQPMAADARADRRAGRDGKRAGSPAHEGSPRGAAVPGAPAAVPPGRRSGRQEGRHE